MQAPPSPFMLPASVVDASTNGRKSAFVDWGGEGTKVAWSDDEEDEPKPQQPPQPGKVTWSDDDEPVVKRQRTRVKAKATPARLFVCSGETFATTVLAARKSFETTYVVPIDSSFVGQCRGASELTHDPADVVTSAEEISRILTDEQDAAVIVVEEEIEDTAPVVARIAVHLLKRNGGRTAACGIPTPKDEKLARLCRRMGPMRASAAVLRGMLKDL